MTSLALLLVLQAAPVSAPHPFRVEDLQKLRRLNEAVLSPDGRWVAYSIQTSDLKKNKSVTNLWLLPSAGGSPTQLTFADHGSNSLVRWAPDSKSIYFLSNRDKDTPQIFRLSLGGGEASQVSHFAIGVNSFLLSPDGKTLAITASVDNATLLWKAGVKVAVAQQDVAHFRDLRQAAGNEVRNGMTWDAALRSVTLSTAEVAGAADRYGSLDVGKVANIVV
jgi:Tol biopolymer transport system component